MEALVRDFVGRLTAAIEANLTGRLQGALASALGTAAAPGRSVAQPAASPARRPVRVSPELVRARKLQGQYLGALRGLKPADHARVKSVAHEKNLAAAIKLAKSLKR